MALIFLHNPSCSTSRKGLELLKEKGVDLAVWKYMNVAERLSEEELRDIAKKLGVDSPMAFARPKNFAAEGVDKDISDDELFKAMAQNPKLIERPILIKGDKAALGRPVENMLTIL